MTQISYGEKVLVGYGSRHGSTREVADYLAATLRSRHVQAETAPVAEICDVSPYGAFVIGSGVYDGSWSPEVTAFVRRQRRALARRPVWFFSVAAFGDSHRVVGRFMKKEPREMEEFLETIAPLGYRVFAGVIDPVRWSRTGRLLHHALGGHDGDNRNWPEIDAWAQSIAEELSLRADVARQKRRVLPASATRRPLLFRSVKPTLFEQIRPLAGDRLIEANVAALTHALTINAPRAAVWPWLVQMGAGSRAGWYSYDFLDNGGAHSAEHIVPALQIISVGTLFPALPGATEGFHLLQVEPQRSLVLGWRGADGTLNVTWAFVLKQLGPNRTRLIVRVRAGSQYRVFGLPPWLGLPLVRALHFIMERKQLLEIARRAESSQTWHETIRTKIA
jgi:menaquinone-dependent protoporphyrinogen oxidase